MQDKSLIFLKYLTIIMGATLTIGVIILIKLIYSQTKISNCKEGEIIINSNIDDFAIYGKKIFILSKNDQGESKIKYYNYCN